jgi:hypothetical protein
VPPSGIGGAEASPPRRKSDTPSTAYRYGILSVFDPPFHDTAVPRERGPGIGLAPLASGTSSRIAGVRRPTFAVDSGTTYRVADGEGSSPISWISTRSAKVSATATCGSRLVRNCWAQRPQRWRPGRSPGTTAGWTFLGWCRRLADIGAEVRVILRPASRLRDQECDSFEVPDIGLGKIFSEGTFTLGLSGVRFDRVDRLT